MIDLMIACTVCLGNADSPLLDAARVGVLTMVAVTVSVLGVFAGWCVKLVRLAGRDSNEADVMHHDAVPIATDIHAN